MNEDTKIDILEAVSFAMVPIVLTSTVLIEFCMFPWLMRSLDWYNSILAAGLLTSIIFGCGYFVFKEIIRISQNTYWRFKH